MKKTAYLLFVLTVALFLQCRKDSADEEVTPQPEVTNPDDSNNILQKLAVPEAEAVSFDSLRSLFLIKLPATYSGDELTINLSLYPDVSLLDSASSPTSQNSFKFAYKGSRPLNLVFKKKDVSEVRRYDIYVEAQGPPKIELASKDISVRQGVSFFPFKIISGMGTIPSKPEQLAPVVKITDRASGAVSEGTIQNILQNIYFEDLTGLISSSNVAMEVTFEGSAPLTFEGLKLNRGIPRADLTNVPFSLGRNDTLKVKGGYFDSKIKYTAGLSSDFTAGQRLLDLEYGDNAYLSFKFNSDIPEGSYLVTFFENGKEMGKGTFEYSNAKINTLETIWKGDLNLVFKRNVEALVLKKGDEFYAKPSLVQYQWGSNMPSSSFDGKLLPVLRLNNGISTTNLSPEITVVSWAIAGVSYAVGKYKVPDNLAAGAYAVTAIYPNQAESKPYWSKIQIR